MKQYAVCEMSKWRNLFYKLNCTAGSYQFLLVRYFTDWLLLKCIFFLFLLLLRTLNCKLICWNFTWWFLVHVQKQLFFQKFFFFSICQQQVSKSFFLLLKPVDTDVKMLLSAYLNCLPDSLLVKSNYPRLFFQKVKLC